MLDPFHFPAPDALQALTVPAARQIGLHALPLHIHELLFALVFYSIFAHVISPALSARFFPERFPKLDARTKINWNVHVLSFLQSSIASALSLYIIFNDEERMTWRADEKWEERIWGYTGLTGMAQSFALAYFLYDLYVCLRYVHIFGWAMVVHAIASSGMFVAGFRPFIYFYCPVFLLHELSTPFLNIHWFCDKLDLTGSVYQAVNGAFLITTFFGARLVWGTYSAFNVSRDVYRAVTIGCTAAKCANPLKSIEHGIFDNAESQTSSFMSVQYLPVWLGAVYITANVSLAILNFWWFSQMIQTIRKRFDPPWGTKGVGTNRRKPSANGKKTS